MVQNVRYWNGQPGHVTLPFEYMSPIFRIVHRHCTRSMFILFQDLQNELAALRDSVAQKSAGDEKSGGPQIIPFFSFARAPIAKERKIVFSLLGPLKTSSASVPFMAPQNYAHTIPFRYSLDLNTEQLITGFKRIIIEIVYI